MIPILATAAWFVAGYLAGSIPFGWLIGKVRGVDIREHGSRNIGATNCGRVCGWPWGVLAFGLDVAKGFFPVYTAALWLPNVGNPFWGTVLGDKDSGWIVVLLVTLTAVGPIVGHTFPVWLKFRGGKAVATSLGVLLGIPGLWWVALAALGVWVVVVLATGYVSVASSAAAIAFAAIYLYAAGDQAWGDNVAVTVFVLLLVMLVLVRHGSNYRRLLRGTENRLWGRKRAKADGA
ncbi:MAG TPA: glycerol-3-phosphate 1-O-acyltransferase PlsY [Phycisphaerae bacterium]|nr:glycerol-3-phosphate 1-O-acyltransferase PlsY [Phycisphaerae bacterium]